MVSIKISNKDNWVIKFFIYLGCLLNGNVEEYVFF